MNISKIFSLLAFFLFTSCFNADTKKATKESLTDALYTFNKAFANGNISILSGMLTENYTHTNGSAKAIYKTDWLAYLKKRSEELASGNLTVNNYEMDQIEIEMHKSTAIVTGRVKTSTVYNGESKENEYRVTHLWVHTNNSWKRAAFHDGKIK